METGKVYHSIREASKECYISATSISEACAHPGMKRGGYHWEFTGVTSRPVPGHAKVPVRCVETGEVYPTIADAQRDKKCDNVSNSLLMGYASGGYHWERLVEEF